MKIHNVLYYFRNTIVVTESCL